MKTNILLLGLGVCLNQSFSQVITFQKKISDTQYPLQGFFIQKTINNGFVFSGAPNICPMALTGDPPFLFRTDSAGNILSAKVYKSGPGDEQTLYVFPTQDSGFILSGDNKNLSAGNQDIYLLKLDAAGNVQWAKNYGGALWDAANHILQTNDGGYIVTGWIESFGAGSLDVLLMKVDGNGNLQWAKAFGGSEYDYGTAISITSDGGFLIAGRAESFVGSSENCGFWLIRTDSNGNLLWSKIFEAFWCNVGGFIQQTSDDGYIVPMYIFSFGIGLDAGMLKLDSAGNQIWLKIVNEPGNELFMSAGNTSDGGYIFGGYQAKLDYSESNMFMLRTDSMGTMQWAKVYGDTAAYEEGWCAIETPDSGFILIGESKPDTVNCELYIVKTDASGNSGCKEFSVSPDIIDTSFSEIIPSAIVTDITSLLTVSSVTPTVTTLSLNQNILCYTAIEENSHQEFSFEIFPNPANQSITIAFNFSLSENVSLKIYDLLGQEMEIQFSRTGKGFLIQRGNLKQGVYLVKLQTESGVKCAKLQIID